MVLFTTLHGHGGGGNIRKISQQRKNYLDRQSQLKTNKKVRSGSKHLSRKKQYRKVFKAPEHFSIINNPSQTLEYFNEILLEARAHHFDERFYIDLTSVSKMSIDAIMYLLALIRTLRSFKTFRAFIYGNTPVNEECKQMLSESGFYSYMAAEQQLSVNYETDRIQISEGKSVEPNKVAEVCLFLGKNVMGGTKALFGLLIELITNTVQHAYSIEINTRQELSKMSERWYIYVDQNKQYYSFSFLDTGLGIPRTVRKKFFEDTKTDSEYILSALKGEKRTQTKKGYRGNGLPFLYELAHSRSIDDLFIVAGSGMYCSADGRDSMHELEKPIEGTLISWTIPREKSKDGVI